MSKADLSMPISEALYEVFYNGKSIKDQLNGLFERMVKAEFRESEEIFK